MEVRTLRCEGTSSNELDEGDEWAPTLAEHTVLTEPGIPYGRRLLGERSHRSSLSWGKPSTWRRVTGLEASEREGMRDAESRPEWMPRSGKRYTPKGVYVPFGEGQMERGWCLYMTQYLASCLLYFKTKHVETEQDLHSLLANTGGLVYNSRVVTNILMLGRRDAHVMEKFLL